MSETPSEAEELRRFIFGTKLRGFYTLAVTSWVCTILGGLGLLGFGYLFMIQYTDDKALILSAASMFAAGLISIIVSRKLKHQMISSYSDLWLEHMDKRVGIVRDGEGE